MISSRKFTKIHGACRFVAALFLIVLTIKNAKSQVLPTPAAERMQGLEARKLLNQNALKGIKFQNIGPNLMSGRVVDIDVNEADPKEFYVVYASGGLWYTNNNGQSFIPVFDKQESITIGDVAVNWNKGIVWVGTGEANSSRSSYAGTGVYKSTNRGKTWQNLGLAESHHIGKVMLHPSNENVAWVAVLGHLYSFNKERGVYKTIDGGATWKQTLYVDDSTGCIDLDINLKDPDELFASMWHRERTAWNFVEAGYGTGIYKSNDGGETWKLVTGGTSGLPQGNLIGRIGISVHQANPKIIYASVDNQNRRPDTSKVKVDSNAYHWKDLRNISKENFLKLDDKKLDSFLIKNDFPAKYKGASVKQLVKNGEVKPTVLYEYLKEINPELDIPPVIGCEIYRSDNGGVSWKKMNEKGNDIYFYIGYYFGKISVSPLNPNKILVSGIYLHYSIDGGKNFRTVDKKNTHSDWHGGWINPRDDKHWIFANDGGCNLTYDNGQHWFKANMPPVGQFYAIDVDENKPYNIYGGLQDNGTWYGPSKPDTSNSWDRDKAPEWKRVSDGDGMQVQVDTRDNKTVYSGYQFGEYARRVLDQRGAKRIYPQNDLGTSAVRYNWQTPIVLSKHNQDILYYGTDRFYRSMNKGDSMQLLSEDLTGGKRQGDVPFGTMTTISESPLRFGLLYIGTDDGRIQVSKDGGYTWSLVSQKMHPGLYVSRVVASKYKLGKVYVTLNGYRNDHFKPYLYVSEDFGTSWRKLGENLPPEPLNVIREDAKFEDIIYVGSDNGVYASLDRGISFQVMDTSLPRVSVHDIAIPKTANEIVLGTHGRSIYTASLNKLHTTYDSLYHKPGIKNKTETGLQLFDWKKMNDGELDVDCPPAKPKRKSKKKEMKAINYSVKN